MQRASTWILAAIATSAMARPGHAQPALAGPCPDYDAYKNSLFVHRRWETTACYDDGSIDCERERTAVSQLEQGLAACQAGHNIGPPPTHFDVPARELHRVRTIGLVEGIAGGSVALAGSDWRSSAELSPAVTGRFGAMHGGFGGLLAITWTPQRLTSPSAVLPFGTSEHSLHLFRFVAEAVAEHRVTPQLALDARAGAGIDVGYVSFQHLVSGTASNEQATDIGLAAEAGGDAWWTVGEGVDLGASLTLPYTHHGGTTTASESVLSYSSLDVELLLGVRIRSSGG